VASWLDLKITKEKWGDRICLGGNIDLVNTLPCGTAEEVDAEVKHRIEGAAVRNDGLDDFFKLFFHQG
jgi:hypothetical protein